MQHFHFDIHDGRWFPDMNGRAFAGWDEALIEAVRIAGILQDQAAQLGLRRDWRMEVANEKGLIVFSIASTAAASLKTSIDRD